MTFTNLSNEEVQERSKILGEAFGEDAELIIKKLLSYGILATINNEIEILPKLDVYGRNKGKEILYSNSKI